ncbi:response regulator transcription factor [Actinomadura rubrisoli]|uniref:Response regulator transcription factor n=2 Tax=Actinomadura rubrisoli TaxID=2530368 RepID=A0A4R5BXF5_9ACTN|nr:response regulator transcription factor [Actinomadura rubrisoli]
MIRVFLVDDHPLFLAGVRAALEGAGMNVIGEADTGEAALRALRRSEVQADVVLLELRLSGMSGVEVIREVNAGDARRPHPGVLVVSLLEDDDAVVGALRAGARGYMVKRAPLDELLLAVRIVADGGAVLSPTFASRLALYFTEVHELPHRAAFPELTDREREVLDLLARGYDNRHISRKLVLAEKTVRNHISHVFSKLQVSDRAAAVARARDAGLGSEEHGVPGANGGRTTSGSGQRSLGESAHAGKLDPCPTGHGRERCPRRLGQWDT